MLLLPLIPLPPAHSQDWDELRQGMALLVQENKLLIQTAEEAQMASDSRKRGLDQEARWVRGWIERPGWYTTLSLPSPRHLYNTVFFL